MIYKRWIGRDWKGSSHGVIEVLYWKFSSVTGKNHDKESRKCVPSET